jgi:hypothetical protein
MPAVLAQAGLADCAAARRRYLVFYVILCSVMDGSMIN